MYIKQSCIIISIGTELTDGQVQDDHLKFIAPLLKGIGLQVIRSVQIPDSFELIKWELEKALEDCDSLIITGGLGPTSDDITRDVVANVTERDLIFSKNLWEELKRKYPVKKIAETNKKQVFIPESFKVLENKWGTAPGFYGKNKNCLIFVLPGPPRELRPMFENSVLPALITAFGHSPVNKEQIAAAFLIPESELEAGFLKCRIKGISWQTRLETDRIVFTVKGETEKKINVFMHKIKNYFGEGLIRKENIGCTYLLFNALIRMKKIIAFAESCTGGLLGKLITDIPGSSGIFAGSLVVYTNTLKSNLLGVEPEIIEKQGVVSEEVVIGMATGVIKQIHSDYSIAVSGVAGPDGGTVEKPVGTVWICIADRKLTVKTWKYTFTGNRESVRMKTAVAAFLNAERIILN